MKRLHNQYESSKLVFGIVLTVAGIVLAILQAKAVSWLIYLFAVLALLRSIRYFVRKSYPKGASMLVLSVLLFLGGWKIADLMLLFIGILILVLGVVSLVALIQSKVPFRQMINAIFMIILGFLLILCRWFLVNGFVLAVGILLIVKGVMSVVYYITH